ncbi:hypothetical protein GIB67_033513 [Kingdonia uniflora]|uniref:Uncharacterized protein n=1 Tax=Kingdonia uniflora TaxID=39325 RepID=A0A7J7L6C8_9MAGN|nr:hypothetical protein GIB67_033513 [Kingdonia uniflora]
MDRRNSRKKMTHVQIDIARKVKRVIENLGTKNNLNPRVREVVPITFATRHDMGNEFRDRLGSMIKNQIDAGKVDLTVLFGPECTGRVRVIGFGILPMVYNSVQHSGVLVQSLQDEVKEL